ncbi:MAG: endonuclease/exonuclease/phosphatase family protein [Alistipes sp.]
MGKKATLYLLYHLSVIATVALLVVAILCRRAALVDPQLGVIWLFWSLSMPVVLFVNFCVLVFWLFRRKWWVAVIPLAAILLNGGYLSTMFQLPKGNSLPTTNGLKVATLNTYGFRAQGSVCMTAQETLAMLQREQVDVVCFQEFLDSKGCPLDRLIAYFTHYMPYYHHEQAMAVFSRYPIVEYEYRNVKNSNNSCLRTDIEVQGTVIRLVSVHLQTSGVSMARRKHLKDYGSEMPAAEMLDVLQTNVKIRTKQVADIRAMINRKSMPVIVAGDFNDVPSSYIYHVMRAGLTDGFQACGSGFGATYRHFVGMLRIDYLFYNDSFQGLRYYMPADDLSDHRCIVAELQLLRKPRSQKL